jgi:hypothetical protein
MRKILIRNNTNEVQQWIKEFQPNEIFEIPGDSAVAMTYATYDPLLQAITNQLAQIGNGESFYTSTSDQISWLTGSVPFPVNSTSDLILSWSVLKAFYIANKELVMLNYIDLDTHYYIWCDFRDQKMFCPELRKEEASDFETNYKPICNKKEAFRTRITTCELGRAYQARFMRFSSASTSNNNYDYKDNLLTDFVVKTIKKVDTNYVECTPSESTETWVEWEPVFNYEIIGGILYVPANLPEGNWTLHVNAVPDLPEAYGGSKIFISNCDLTWFKGTILDVDCSLNPKELKYNNIYHSNKLRLIIKHPQGVQANFQFNFKIFKD